MLHRNKITKTLTNKNSLFPCSRGTRNDFVSLQFLINDAIMLSHIISFNVDGRGSTQVPPRLCLSQSSSCCHLSLLFTPTTAVALAITHSHHDSTPILASQISLPLVSLFTKPYSFDTLARVAEIGSCSHLRILY